MPTTSKVRKDLLEKFLLYKFDNDECTSTLDFFERSDLREAALNASPEVQGIATQVKAVKTFTMNNNQSSAATIREYPGLNGKRFLYQIQNRKRRRHTYW